MLAIPSIPSEVAKVAADQPLPLAMSTDCSGGIFGIGVRNFHVVVGAASGRRNLWGMFHVKHRPGPVRGTPRRAYEGMHREWPTVATRPLAALKGL